MKDYTDVVLAINDVNSAPDTDWNNAVRENADALKNFDDSILILKPSNTYTEGNSNETRKNLFALISTFSNSFECSGSANNYQLNQSNQFIYKLNFLIDNIVIGFQATFSNTGSCNCNINNIGSLPFKDISGADLVQGNIIANNYYYIKIKNNVIYLLNKTNISQQIFKTASFMQCMEMQDFDNWLLCDGRALSRSQYNILFNYLLAKNLPFGAGDGSTTFNIPNCQGRVIGNIGKANGLITTRQFGQNLGSETFYAGVPSHSHNLKLKATANLGSGTGGIIGQISGGNFVNLGDRYLPTENNGVEPYGLVDVMQPTAFICNTFIYSI